MIKTEVSLDCDDPFNQDLLLQENGDRIKKSVITRQIEQILFWRRISEYCWNWAILHDERNCRSLTISCSDLSRRHSSKKDNYHKQKDGSKGTQRLGPYWKLVPVICMVSMELRSEFGLWTETTLTLGSEFLVDQTGLWWIWSVLNKKFQKLEEYPLKLDAKSFACRSKNKAKPQRRESVDSSPRTNPIGKRTWTDVESVKIFFLRLWSIVEIDSCTSTWKSSTARRWWSESILENYRKSS